MHPKLQAIVDDFDRASERLERLAASVPHERWPERPEAGRWSIAECVTHLNLTAQAFLPVVDEALEAGRGTEHAAPIRYRRDPLGWLMWRTMAPPVRIRLKTGAAFVPEADAPVEATISDFERLQVQQIACVGRAQGLPLQKLRIRSPFDRRVRYNLYSALSLLPRHQHRHLWQAEQVAAALESR